ncbi:MAG: D-aminoacylase [Betaproteobacteria bacterium]|nr:D-aminoacylase [Betaproteobacteria bacterium]
MSRVLMGMLFLALAACNSIPGNPVAAHGTAGADLLIRNGRIVDGTGNSWFLGDVAVKDGKIVAIGHLDEFKAARTIDARRHIVAPGFIDVHGHIENVLDIPTADNYVHDGVTTVITGNCGGSADRLPEFLAGIDGRHTSINVASLVGHNTVRRLVMGLEDRRATPDEQRQMEAMVEQAMRDGAVGLSTGLIYLPGLYSTTDEVVGLARASARHHGIYASHIRDEGNKVAEAIQEAIDIGRQAKLPVEISHFKVTAPANWGRSRETLALVESARREGLDVTIDQYPYTASSTNLGVMAPDWALSGGMPALRKRIADPAEHKRIAEEMLATAVEKKRKDFSYAVVARHGADPSLNGKNISVINRAKGREATLAAEIETMLDLLLAGGAQIVFHGMIEEDVRTIMKYPFSMVGADGGVQDGSSIPHPRSYGTNARVLGKYVREEQLVPLEEAVRRMTSLAAQKFQLKGRGLLREGYAADIVVFDDRAVIDKATFENPHQFSTGFDYVLVNGRIVIEQDRHTGVRSGVALKGPAFVAER